MRFDNSIPAFVGGVAIASALVVTLAGKTVALTGTQVNYIAREVTVLIVGETETGKGHGSGVIIAKYGNNYYDKYARGWRFGKMHSGCPEQASLRSGSEEGKTAA